MRISLSLVALFSISFAALAQDFTPVSSKVKSATVYLSNAQLTNSAVVSLKTGSNTFVFTNLSPFLDKNSIRVSADKEVNITGVNLKTNYLDEAEMPGNFNEVNTKLKDAEFNLSLRQSYRRVYEEERSLVLANKKVLGDNSKLSIEDFVELANIYRNRLKEIEVKILEITQEEKRLAKDVAKYKAQMGDRSNNLNQNRSEIELTVYAKTAGSCTFDISYLVYNAGWVPSYEIRTDDGNSPVKLIYKANVFQSTAIDWTDTKISLSTGNPNVNGTQPILYPDYVDFIQQMNTDKKFKAESVTTYSTPLIMSDRGSNELEEVTVVQGNVNVYFDIAIPYNIPSTLRPTGVEIQQFDLPVENQYLSIPKLERSVYLVAAIKGFEKLNLLPGEASVYYKNSFVGKSNINPYESKDKLEVSLGVDNSVVVERKDLNEIAKDGGILSSNKKQYHYKFIVKNNKQRSVNIRVEDQMPLARNNSIVVENENLTGGSLNAETGIISWNILLQPGESREFELKYSIKFPKGQKIDH